MKIKKQFKQSIKCGTGEAYFILTENPQINFSKIILKAAKKNYAYDAQSEGNRAIYIEKLIDHCPQKNLIIKKVIRALKHSNEDTWGVDQLFEINAILAKKGNAKARKAIYRRYKKNKFESDWLGQEQIIQLDGFKGLKLVAATRGKSLSRNKDDWEWSFLVDSFQENHPHIDVLQKLKKAAKKNKYIKKYLNTILKNKKKKKRSIPKQKMTYQLISKNIQQLKIVPASIIDIKELSTSDIFLLVNDFLKESNPNKQEKYLRIFARRKFPISYHPILKIANGKNKKDSRLIEFACQSLKFFKGEDIRNFALKKLPKTDHPGNYLYLLVSNYKKGDAKLITKIIANHSNEHILHDMIYGLLEIYQNNKTRECKKPLELMYRKLTCGIHRNDLLRILYENQSLSKKILKELEFDSFGETTQLFKKIKSKNSTL